jgi:hypothetical protein
MMAARAGIDGEEHLLEVVSRIFSRDFQGSRGCAKICSAGPIIRNSRREDALPASRSDLFTGYITGLNRIDRFQPFVCGLLSLLQLLSIPLGRTWFVSFRKGLGIEKN